MNIDDYIKEGFLQKILIDRVLIKKELAEAEYDLQKAQHAFDEEDYKWCIIKCYCSMFHASRALLFSTGLRERRHFAISIVLENMNKQGKLESRFLTDFSSAMSAREDADYHYKHSRETTVIILESAKEFMKKFKTMVK
ncbi:MAG: HEPN domain-containing protein [Candidatus Aenigmatarchaeota archaeon]